MINAMKCRKNQECSTAHVVDGKLILSFPGALTPVVWQMDLAQTKASALEVREHDGGKSYALFLKTPKGESIDVAQFSKKSQAVDGLTAAASALSRAHGQIRTGNIANSNEASESYIAPARKKGFSWKTFILGCLLIFALLTVWSSFTAPPTAQIGDEAVAPATQTETGVPLSADEFLRNR